jgi:hypothetical protein
MFGLTDLKRRLALLEKKAHEQHVDGLNPHIYAESIEEKADRRFELMCQQFEEFRRQDALLGERIEGVGQDARTAIMEVDDHYYSKLHDLSKRVDVLEQACPAMTTPAPCLLPGTRVQYAPNDEPKPGRIGTVVTRPNGFREQGRTGEPFVYVVYDGDSHIVPSYSRNLVRI